jgi:hypothetical protein
MMGDRGPSTSCRISAKVATPSARGPTWRSELWIRKVEPTGSPSIDRSDRIHAQSKALVPRSTTVIESPPPFDPAAQARQQQPPGV